MPARILVLGGDDPTNVNSELNTVSSSFSPDQQWVTQNMFQMDPGQRRGSLSDPEGDLVPERPDFMDLSVVLVLILSIVPQVFST